MKLKTIGTNFIARLFRGIDDLIYYTAEDITIFIHPHTELPFRTLLNFRIRQLERRREARSSAQQ